MAIQSFKLDPNATSYTDDEIVGKINTASTPITREDALDQESLKLVKTNPASGEFNIRNIQRDTDGKLDVEYEDTPEA
jgi:hypothetical protein